MISWIKLFNNCAKLSVNLSGHLSPFLILIVEVAKFFVYSLCGYPRYVDHPISSDNGLISQKLL